MKIVIFGTSNPGGRYERLRAITKFLISKHYVVDTITYPNASYKSKLWFNYQKLHARLNGHEKRVMNKI